MNTMKFQKILTGLDIDRDSIKVARIEKESNGWKLVQCASASFPEETVKLSFKAINIIDADRFLDTVKRAMKLADGEVSQIEKTFTDFFEVRKKFIPQKFYDIINRTINLLSPIPGVGLSLPNETIKIAIQEYGDLPGSRIEIDKMIAWKTAKSLHFSMEDTKISHCMIGEGLTGEKRLLVTIGMKNVINKFEQNLTRLKINAKVIRPAGINQLNFFINHLPSKGVIAYIGLFEYFFTFFVFEDAHLAFYHGVKKGFSDLQFFQDVDLVMSYYQRENPGKMIEKLCIGSHVGFHKELKEVFGNLSEIDVQIIDENRLINTDHNLVKFKKGENISHYISAIGAAQSLVL